MAMNTDVKCAVGEINKSEPGYQAYLILKFLFVVAPILAGLDKFFYYLTDWSQYISAEYIIIGDAHRMVMIAGVIEIVAGIGVLLRPKVFAYIIAVWLLGIIVNLLILGDFYDIALREFGLMLAAVALGRLSSQYCVCCCERKAE